MSTFPTTRIRVTANLNGWFQKALTAEVPRLGKNSRHSFLCYFANLRYPLPAPFPFPFPLPFPSSFSFPPPSFYSSHSSRKMRLQVGVSILFSSCPRIPLGFGTSGLSGLKSKLKPRSTVPFILNLPFPPAFPSPSSASHLPFLVLFPHPPPTSLSSSYSLLPFLP
jgi:hypothetical protein